jgi:hypothetical protein
LLSTVGWPILAVIFLVVELEPSIFVSNDHRRTHLSKMAGTSNTPTSMKATLALALF